MRRPTVPEILSEVVLKRELHTPSDGGRHWLAYVGLDGEWVASLSWNSTKNMRPVPFPSNIDSIEVGQSYRRRGVATALWREVREMEPDLHHADPSEWSLDGAVWIAAIGGPIAHYERVDPSVPRVRRIRQSPRRPADG